MYDVNPVVLNLSGAPSSEVKTAPADASGAATVVTAAGRQSDQAENASPHAAETGEGLRQLIAENAALGKALQAIVGDFGKGAGKSPEDETASDVAPLAAPVAVDSAVTSAEATGKSLLPSADGDSTDVVLPALPQLVTENAALGAILSDQAEEIQGVVAAVVREATGEALAKREATGEATFQSLPGSATAEALAKREATGEATFQSLPGSATAETLAKREATGEAAFQSLQAAPAAVDAAAASVEATGKSLLPGAADVSLSPSVASLVSAADAVADAILLSPDLRFGSGEISIQLKPDVLAGSTVTVAVTGRQVEVTFIPATHEIAVLLAGNQSVVAAQLATRIRSFDVSVDVRRNSSYDSEERA